MNEWQRLLEDLEQDGPLDEGRIHALKARIKRESELRQKKWMLSVTIDCLIGLGVLWFGGVLIRDVDDVRLSLLGVVAMIIGFEITVLAKLGYGNLFSLNKILETVREVQVTLIEHLRASSAYQEESES